MAKEIKLEQYGAGQSPQRPPLGEKSIFIGSDSKFKVISGDTGLVTNLDDQDGVATPTNVATNTAKLALTGIAAGTEVIVTGEANRFERYMGTNPNSDSNWTVLGPNTFELFIYAVGTSMEADDSINGVLLVNGASTSVGWVYAGQPLVVLSPTGVEMDWTVGVNNKISFDGTLASFPVSAAGFQPFFQTTGSTIASGAHILAPSFVSPRGSLQLEFTGTA